MPEQSLTVPQPCIACAIQIILLDKIMGQPDDQSVITDI